MTGETARHDIQCSTLLFFIRGKQASERFWGGMVRTPTPPPGLQRSQTQQQSPYIPPFFTSVTSILLFPLCRPLGIKRII